MLAQFVRLRTCRNGGANRIRGGRRTRSGNSLALLEFPCIVVPLAFRVFGDSSAGIIWRTPTTGADDRHRLRFNNMCVAPVTMFAAGSRPTLIHHFNPTSAAKAKVALVHIPLFMSAKRSDQQSTMQLTHRSCPRIRIAKSRAALNIVRDQNVPAGSYVAKSCSTWPPEGTDTRRSYPDNIMSNNIIAAAKEDDMVYRRTIYDHGDWSRHRSNSRHSRHMLAIATSRVVAGLLPPVVKLTLVASALVLFNMLVAASCPLLWWAPGLLHVSSLPFQLVAPAVALLLVFRTNASYGRFDEARKAWASIVNRSRDMTRQAVTFFRHPADAAKLHDLLRYLVVFPYCLKDHLTREDDLNKELSEIIDEADLQGVISSPHRPSYVLQTITQIIHNSHLSDMQKALLDSNVTNLHDNVGGCERIFTTPIPVSYTRLTSRILVIWHLLLPLALWDQCTWVTIPATFLSAAALFCIEEVGVLIEEPFSILPLGSICNSIRTNVETILHQQRELNEKPRFLKNE